MWFILQSVRDSPCHEWWVEWAGEYLMLCLAMAARAIPAVARRMFTTLGDTEMLPVYLLTTATEATVTRLPGLADGELML